MALNLVVADSSGYALPLDLFPYDLSLVGSAATGVRLDETAHALYTLSFSKVIAKVDSLLATRPRLNVKTQRMGFVRAEQSDAVEPPQRKLRQVQAFLEAIAAKTSRLNPTSTVLDLARELGVQVDDSSSVEVALAGLEAEYFSQFQILQNLVPVPVEVAAGAAADADAEMVFVEGADAEAAAAAVAAAAAAAVPAAEAPGAAPPAAAVPAAEAPGAAAAAEAVPAAETPGGGGGGGGASGGGARAAASVQGLRQSARVRVPRAMP